MKLQRGRPLRDKCDRSSEMPLRDCLVSFPLPRVSLTSITKLINDDDFRIPPSCLAIFTNFDPGYTESENLGRCALPKSRRFEFDLLTLLPHFRNSCNLVS